MTQQMAEPGPENQSKTSTDWSPGDGIDWQSYVTATRGKYISRYVTLAQQNTHDYPRLEEELANLLNTAQQAWDQRAYDKLLEMAEWLWSGGGQFLDLRGDAQVGIQLLTQALEAARLLGDKRQEGRLLGQLGRAWMARRKWPRSAKYFEQALEIARQTRNRQEEASHLGNLGQIFLEQEDKTKAAEYFYAGMKLARKIRDRQMAGRLEASLGLVKMLNYTRGSIDEAIEHFRNAIKIARKTRDRRGEASHLGSLGRAYELLGQHGLSLPPFVSGPYPEQDDDRRTRYYKEVEQANRKMYFKAYQYYEQALMIANDIQDRSMQARFRGDRLRVGARGGFPMFPDGDINWNIWMRNPSLVALQQDK